MQPLCYYIGRAGENNMSKYCRPMGLYVTYLDCMECEGKECITKREEQTNVSMEEQEQTRIAKSVPCMESVNLRKGEQEDMKKVYLLVDIGTELFLVFASKREGYKQNIVFRAEVVKATIDKDGVTYNCEINRCMNDKTVDVNKYVKFYMFRNANIDTGHRGMDKQYYPVFTTKEGCLKWLKG